MCLLANRKFHGTELSLEYCEIVKQRIGTEEIEYNGVVLALTTQLTRNIPSNLLTAKDRKYLIDKPIVINESTSLYEIKIPLI